MIHTIISNNKTTYAYEKEKNTVLINQQIIQFISNKAYVFGLSKYSKIYTFYKNIAKDTIECIEEQTLSHENNIIYINTCYNADTMDTEFIAIDEKGYYYTYKLNYDGFIDTPNYLKKGFFFKLDNHAHACSKLLHVFQRDLFWYIIRIDTLDKSSSTYLDIYFPNKVYYTTRKLINDVCIDAIMNGIMIYLLLESDIVLYNILENTSSFLFEKTSLSNNHFKNIFMRSSNSLFVTDNNNIYEINKTNDQIYLSNILQLSFGINVCCYPHFDIKSNTNDHCFPYVCSKLLNKDIVIWKKEITIFENICNNLYNNSIIKILKSPPNNSNYTSLNMLWDSINIIEDTICDIDIDNEIDMDLYKLQINTELYFTKWLFSTSINSNTCTSFYNILGELPNRILVEFVKNTDIFGDSYILYRHPVTKVLHFVPDHSSWIKIISYNKNIKIPIQFYIKNGPRQNMFCRFIKGQKLPPYMY